MIISVGYKVNSKRGVEFRIWASKILKDDLIKAYALNEKRLSQQNEQLRELQNAVKIKRKVLNYKVLENSESTELIKIIADYAYGLEILDQYDYHKLEIQSTSGKETYQLTYTEAIDKINHVRKAFSNSDLFGIEKDNSIKSSVSTIYQTFDGVTFTQALKKRLLTCYIFIHKKN